MCALPIRSLSGLIGVGQVHGITYYYNYYYYCNSSERTADENGVVVAAALNG